MVIEMAVMRLTPFGKLILFFLIVAGVGGITYFLGGFDQFIPGKLNVDMSGEDVLQLSLDEWIGWKPIMDANGGLTTKKGSIYDQLGLKVKINIINDATQSSTALINNNLHAAGYTINRYAFLYPKFIENKAPVKMVYITNYSNGGDGIICKQGINRIEDLVGKKIGVPRFSEAQTLIEWLLAKSSLSDSQVRGIRKNMVFFNTPDDAAKAFFGGQIDAAATWQPYLSQATSTVDAKILFSTKSATNLILDGIVFRQDYIAKYPERVKKFIEGSLRANDLYKKEFGPIKESMPLFATEKDESILGMTDDAALAGFAANKELAGGIAQSLFVDMSKIWRALGEKSSETAVNSAFDFSLLETLSDRFSVLDKDPVEPFTEAQRKKAIAEGNEKALMTQRLTINFETNSSAIQSESFEALKKFAETAKILNRVIIQIEGNTDSAGDYTFNKELSAKRAKAVALYLQYQGIEPSRFIIIGNGPDKPLSGNETADGRATNRRTDIFFKVVN
jgi:outer membrane protein OmpA-like peptidoglycan-associated protein/ABC-type amino acid transport substrate-binding protein